LQCREGTCSLPKTAPFGAPKDDQHARLRYRCFCKRSWPHLPDRRWPGHGADRRQPDPSGCGKTTFLRVIADLEKPTSGTITVNGLSPEEARKRRAYGYVFQAAALYPWRTIEKNIALPLEIMGHSRDEQKARVARTLDLVNLTGFGKKYPWQLSGGMQQRASIARALAFDADLLLMDEPFGALDEIVRDHLNEQLLKLWAATQKTICFVTHSIPEAVYLSTKIVVMSPRPGRVTDIIDSPLPKDRPLGIRETPEFLEIAHRVREGLRAGHSYEEHA
jgi:NitT/TauT family transport system ATP-binding protein